MADYSSQLVKQQFLAEGKFKNPNEPGIRPSIGALAAIASLTRSTINDDLNAAKKREVEVFWPEPNCAPEVTDTSTSCTITATEPESNSKLYTLNRPKSPAPYKLARRKFETSMHSRDEMIAVNALQQEKAAFENLNQRVHAVLNTPANKTDISDAGYGVLSDNVDPVTKDILIHPAQWTASGIMPVVFEVASRLGMRKPTIITGGALYRMFYDVWKDAQSGDVRRLADFDAWLDWSMDATLAGEKFFLVDEGVAAILNRPDFLNTTPEYQGDDRTTWSRSTFMADSKESEFSIGTGLTSGKGTSLKLDIEHQIICDTRKNTFDAYRYSLNADMVLAPQTTCSATAIGGNPYTGIIGVGCGIVAES